MIYIVVCTGPSKVSVEHDKSEGKKRGMCLIILSKYVQVLPNCQTDNQDYYSNEVGTTRWATMPGRTGVVACSI